MRGRMWASVVLTPGVHYVDQQFRMRHAHGAARSAHDLLWSGVSERSERSECAFTWTRGQGGRSGLYGHMAAEIKAFRLRAKPWWGTYWYAAAWVVALCQKLGGEQSRAHTCTFISSRASKSVTCVNRDFNL